MKRVITFLLLCLTMSLVAQNYKTLSLQEIRDCKSPEAVAWNFVVSVLLNQYDVMESLSSPDLVADLHSMMSEYKSTNYTQIFTEQRMHDIVGIRPILHEGYHLVCSDPYYHSLDGYTDLDGYTENQACSVRFDCVDNYGNHYAGEHDADCRVILIHTDNKWVVRGFK